MVLSQRLWAQVNLHPGPGGEQCRGPVQGHAGADDDAGWRDAARQQAGLQGGVGGPRSDGPHLGT